MKALSALMDFFIPGKAGKKPPVPKYTLVADPTNKRGNFGKGRKTRPLRAIYPPAKPNCRAEYAGRVLKGKAAFVYPGNRPDWQ
jgi:hypothetical protein